MSSSEDRELQDTLATVVHELRSPLTSIIGYTELALDAAQDNDMAQVLVSLAVVSRNALRLQALLDTVNGSSHIADAAQVDVNSLAGRVIKSLQLVSESKGVKVIHCTARDMSRLVIYGDSGQLLQVFDNLISNAIKFTPAGGTVEVSVHRQGSNAVEITVVDTGIGIPPDEQANVFTRHFRTSTATQSGIPGSGIGLSIVKEIVERHHGTISFAPVLPKGTVFKVVLPMRTTDTELSG